MQQQKQSSILSCENIVVEFDGFKAVDGVDFSMNKGEVRFLIGPNGAGKTTLLDCICGRVRPSKGHVLFKGVDLTRKQEHRIAQLGIGRKFQAPSIFASLSVADNLDLAAHGPRGVLASLTSRADKERQQRQEECLELIRLQEQQNVEAGSLSHGVKQWLEIGMLLMQDPDLLLLDEPAAGMTDDETTKMGEMLHRIALQKSVLVVEHDMDFVRRFAHSVTVMHEGKTLCEGSMEEVQNNERVQEVYLGRSTERTAH
jgi:urea transport system ATP-binding protein